ncbi:MAG: hypothetical protein Q4C75_00200 [Bergeyella zoohelcum]|nr:hypothetical protein [Bergeyella zoohelcum]
MKTIYKIFLAVFILFTGFNIYAIHWNLGFWDEENTKYIFSASAGILGILGVVVLDTWSRLSSKK